MLCWIWEYFSFILVFFFINSNLNLYLPEITQWARNFLQNRDLHIKNQGETIGAHAFLCQPLVSTDSISILSLFSFYTFYTSNHLYIYKLFVMMDRFWISKIKKIIWTISSSSYLHAFLLLHSFLIYFGLLLLHHQSQLIGLPISPILYSFLTLLPPLKISRFVIPLLS